MGGLIDHIQRATEFLCKDISEPENEDVTLEDIGSFDQEKTEFGWKILKGMRQLPVSGLTISTFENGHEIHMDWGGESVDERVLILCEPLPLSRHATLKDQVVLNIGDVPVHYHTTSKDRRQYAHILPGRPFPTIIDCVGSEYGLLLEPNATAMLYVASLNKEEKRTRTSQDFPGLCVYDSEAFAPERLSSYMAILNEHFSKVGFSQQVEMYDSNTILSFSKVEESGMGMRALLRAVSFDVVAQKVNERFLRRNKKSVKLTYDITLFSASKDLMRVENEFLVDDRFDRDRLDNDLASFDVKTFIFQAYSRMG